MSAANLTSSHLTGDNPLDPENFSCPDGSLFHIDEVRYTDFPVREYSVCGWSGTRYLSRHARLWIAADGTSVPCLLGGDRPDVAAYFNHPEMRKSGFVARIPVKDRHTRLEFFTVEDGSQPSVFMLPDPSLWINENSDADPYGDWLEANERSLYWPPEQIPGQLEALGSLPLISVILPTFNTDIYHLHRCVMSLIHQTYRHWELRISDDGSWSPETLAALSKLPALDQRISVVFRKRNEGISVSSNQSLNDAQGEFVVLLDHDDELHPYALLEIVRAVNANSGLDVIYSDEDKIDQSGRRSQPAFKPGYDEDLLLAFNYIGHLVCIRRSLVSKVGGFRAEHDGAQDWDLLLRVMEGTNPERVTRIAKPLYHWRLHENSTSASLDAKPYAQIAWLHVLRDCLVRRNIHGTVEKGLFLGSMRVHREVRQDERIAIFTRVEHGSQECALSRVRRPDRTSLFELSFGGLYDLENPKRDPLTTFADINASVLIFLNCPLDTLNHDLIYELASQCQRSDCGMAGGTVVDYRKHVITGSLAAQGNSRLLNPSEGEHLCSPGYMGLFRVVRSVPALSPGLFAVSATLLAGLGGLSLIRSDWDELCLRAAEECHRRSLKVLFTPYAVATARPPHPAKPFSGALTIPLGQQMNHNLSGFGDPVRALQGRI